jgi:probable F420-dependent oxidoreductase
MQFGLDIPNVHHGLGLDQYGDGEPFNASLAVNPETFRRLARLADEIGFDAVWLADHLVFPPVSEAEHPLGYLPNTADGDQVTAEASIAGTAVRADDPIYDSLITMAFIGALTERCRIGVGVLVIPYRNPVLAAKMIATLDALTGGRIIIGAGVGWLKEAFDAVDADYANRGAVTDEYLDVMRVLWSDDRPSFAGRHYRLPEGLRFLPKPVQRPGVPIWVGGVSAPALRRAASRGDGWLGVYRSPEEYAAMRARIVELLDANRRDASDFTFAHRVRFKLTDRDSATEPCIGTPQHIAAGIRAHHAATGPDDRKPRRAGGAVRRRGPTTHR